MARIVECSLEHLKSLSPSGNQQSLLSELHNQGFTEVVKVVIHGTRITVYCPTLTDDRRKVLATFCQTWNPTLTPLI